MCREREKESRKWYFFKRNLFTYFTVFGCADLADPPAHAMFVRDGNVAELRCKYADMKWSMKCNGQQWQGYYDKCPPPSKFIQSLNTSPNKVYVYYYIIKKTLLD